MNSEANRGYVDPLMGTLKPQSDGALYSNTVIGSMVVGISK